jgi:hypothetical protein
MYDYKEQKIRYARQTDMIESSAETFSRIVDTATKVERQEGMDLANFNRQQVTLLLKAFNAKSRGYLRLICNHFSHYYQWCLTERLVDTTNVTDWYNNNLSKSIIEEVLPNDLIEDKFFGDEEVSSYIESISDPTNKLYVYAPYSGVDGEDHLDIKNLKLSDLDEDK